MRPAQFRLGSISWLFLLTAGCQAFQTHHPVLVQIRDAETNRPLENASVHLFYPRSPSVAAPDRISVRTDAQGVACLNAVSFGETMLLLQADANGYLSKTEELACAVVRKTPPAGWLEDVSKREPVLTVDLYSGPRPTVEFVLPSGFRGTFKAQLKLDDQTPSQPGQRLFRFDVPGREATVLVTGPQVLCGSGLPLFSARYADGQQLPDRPKGLDIGFWWVKGEDGVEYFLVGTDQEYASQKQAEHKPDRASRSAGGAGAAHGRGRRRAGL